MYCKTLAFLGLNNSQTVHGIQYSQQRGTCIYELRENFSHVRLKLVTVAVVIRVYYKVHESETSAFGTKLDFYNYKGIDID